MSIFFRNCFENECFPEEWKKANAVPVYKKIISNQSKITEPYHYCLFVVKFFKEVIIKSFYKYLDDNNHLNRNQSGFFPGDPRTTVTINNP